MDAAAISITAEPVDHTRCRFVVSEPVYQEGLRRFGSPEDAQGSPLAERIFAIPDALVEEVIVSGSVVTVVKRSPTPWTVMGKQVGQAIRAAFASGAPPVTGPARTGPPRVDDDALYGRVAELFGTQVNPMVARHGGHVELIDVQDAVVMLRMAGGCQGCGMADVTLRQGIEGLLAQHVPEVKGIVDVTDHAAGRNPYFQAAKK